MGSPVASSYANIIRYDSYHAHKTFKGIPTGTFLRSHRICSDHSKLFFSNGEKMRSGRLSSRIIRQSDKLKSKQEEVPMFISTYNCYCWDDQKDNFEILGYTKMLFRDHPRYVIEKGDHWQII